MWENPPHNRMNTFIENGLIRLTEHINEILQSQDIPPELLVIGGVLVYSAVFFTLFYVGYQCVEAWSRVLQRVVWREYTVRQLILTSLPLLCVVMGLNGVANVLWWTVMF